MQTPAGSSSGSGVSVAAGFAPLSIGTETDGSIVQPSTRASLYGMKATVGSISTKGTLGWSKVTDSAGGLAKSSGDLAALLGVLLNGTNFDQNLTYSWDNLRVGFVDRTLWDFVPFICDPDPILKAQQDQAYDEAIVQIKAAGGDLQHPVQLPSMKDLEIDGEDVLDQMWSKPPNQLL